MFSVCANPDCRVPFDYRQGRLFRFHKDHPVGEKPPNTHSVQHFWLCGICCGTYTLEYVDGRGVVIKNYSTAVREGTDALRFITAARPTSSRISRNLTEWPGRDSSNDEP